MPEPRKKLSRKKEDMTTKNAINKFKNAINKLPELPLEAFEISGKLKPARDAPVLTIRQKKSRPPHPPVTRDMPLLIPKGEHYIRRYLVDVTYPQVVCYPVPFPDSVITQFTTELSFPDSVIARSTTKAKKKIKEVEMSVRTAKQERFFKLTSYEGKKL